MKKNAFLFVLFSTLGQSAFAQSHPPTQEGLDRVDPEAPIFRPSEAPLNVEKQVQESSDTPSFTREEFAQHPDLVFRALLPALQNNNSAVLEWLLPIYKTQENPDENLVLWGEAVLASSAQDFKKAVNIYRRLLSAYPEHVLLRFRLAQALFANREDEAARAQFERLRTEPFDADTLALIDRYLELLKVRNSWSFYAEVNYVHEDNINNSPGSEIDLGNGRSIRTAEAESASGLRYYGQADKKWMISGPYFTKLALSGNGFWYWDNEKYNEFNARIGLGLGMQNHRSEVVLSPFFSSRWYAGGGRNDESLKHYSHTLGLELNGHYWLDPKWRYSYYAEYSKNYYQRRKHLEGDAFFISQGLTFIPNSARYFFTNLSYHRNNARDKDDAYDRYGMRLGWSEDFGKGITSRLSLSYHKRKYLGPMFFFNEKRENDEYGAQLSLWHRNIHFAGITPRLTWNYQKTSSNIPLYNYQKHDVFLEFSKTF